jgi:hypothetical protein
MIEKRKGKAITLYLTKAPVNGVESPMTDNKVKEKNMQSQNNPSGFLIFV